MSVLTKTQLGVIVFILLTSSLWAKGNQEEKTILIASGAGYKKPVLQVCEEYYSQSGVRVDGIFGNMQTVSTQVKTSGQVGLLIGDLKFLNNPSLGVNYSDYYTIGAGKLVLAYAKGVDIESPEDLSKTSIERISMPNEKNAIYGLAAKEYLSFTNLWEEIQKKIIVASTVPQVSSYLISGEVDAGFINLTDAISIEDQIGGYILLDEGYSHIEIVAGLIMDFESDELTLDFLKYLSSPASQRIFEEYGL